MSDWIKASQLPPDSVSVLVCYEGDVLLAWYDHKEKGWRSDVRYVPYEIEPTHWMPLPEPPE